MKMLGERIMQYVTLDERSVKLMEIGTLVRCKDCKHRPLMRGKFMNVFGPETQHPKHPRLMIEDETCPWLCDDEFYSMIPPDDFFCAYGEEI